MLENIKSLDELWEKVLEINKKHFPENNLMPVLGNGKLFKPKIMFVFINPTIRNISSAPEWQGSRYPFIGTRQVWQVFNKAGFFDSEMAYRIKNKCDWSLEFTDKVLNKLEEKSLYLTNIVKWTGQDAALPNKEKIKLFLPVLKREIELVQPEYIVCFGLIPFEALTGEKIKLREYYDKAVTNKKLKFFHYENAKVIPCYFPVGRGCPKKAVKILKLVKEL